MDKKQTITQYLDTLEFTRLGKQLEAYYSCADSTLHFSETRPSFDVAVVKGMQQKVQELFLRTQIAKLPNFEYMETILPIISYVKKRVLHIEELAKIRIVLHSLKQYEEWLENTQPIAKIVSKTEYTQGNGLKETLASPSLILTQKLNSALGKTIDTQGVLIRNSLPALMALDHKKNTIQKRLQELAKSFIDKNASICTSTVATIRDGRMVVPINVSYKSRVDGIIHGSSGSSQTVFMEIKPLYEQNNEIEMLEMEAQKIVYEKCKELSTLVASHAEQILDEYHKLVEIDVLMAQLQYSRHYEGRFPKIATVKANEPQNSVENTQQEALPLSSSIYLPGARHPLIKNCTPIDIVFEKDTRELILTGPNAGGKTVALKTLGLLALMNQSGIPIPVGEDAILPIFKQVGASIGDHQDIQEGESSFSSQMRWVYEMLPSQGKRTDSQDTDNQDGYRLLLFDEFCSGTDDQEGGALAWAILEALLQHKEYFTILTTHSSLLKHYALNVEGVQIASLEHRTELAFKIVYGVSGSSESARVARKVGLAQSILARQASILSEYGTNTHMLIKKLSKLVRQAENNSYKTRKLLASNKEEARELAQFEQYLRHRELQLRKQSQDEANILIKNVRALLEKLTRKEQELDKQEKHIIEEPKYKQKVPIKKQKPTDSTQITQMRKESQILAEQLKEEAKKGETERHKLSEEFETLKVGDEVEILETGIKGTILTINAESSTEAMYTVRAGIISLNLARDAIQSLQERTMLQQYDPQAIADKFAIKSETNELRRASTDYIVEQDNSTTRKKAKLCIDLRGHTAEEAIEAITVQIDGAILEKWHSFAIIHGMGTLAKAIHTMLKHNEIVKDFSYALPEDGGRGKTYVQL